MTPRPSPLLLLLLVTGAALCQPPAVTLPAHTPLAVQIDNNLPMRVGQPIRASLLYPVYSGEIIALPEKTVVIGTVVALQPDSARRLSARLRADFTPFRTPVVDFTQILLSDGTALPIATGTATDGAPIYRLTAPVPRKGGFFRRQWDTGIAMVRDRATIVTAPGKTDRVLQLVYSQLPWHPQRIESGTAWTVETSAPLNIPPQAAASATPPATMLAARTPAPSKAARPAASQTPEPGPTTWILHGYLNEKLSSETSKQGDSIHATVAEPIYNADHTLAVPVGATIVGTVTRARPARRFGRTGTLRFDFRQLILPTGETQTVQASLTGVDSAAGQNLALNSEGQVKPKPQDKILIPLLLAALAASPLHQDRDASSFELARRNTAASNSIGLIGFIVGTASGSANVAAGFGAYGAALSLYNRWIKRGRAVTFARDTRVILQTTARHSEVLKPDRH